MKDALAEKLLATVMNWSPENVARERPDLQALAAFKYDEYQRFSPGMRFVESLALWLNQLATPAEREAAYEFIRNRLIFISTSEMEHLLSIAFPDYMRPLLINQAAIRMDVPEQLVARIVRSDSYRLVLRQSLFLGLSDGAHIGMFRRETQELSNEQTWSIYDLSRERANTMQSELRSDLEKWLDSDQIDSESRFRNIFLLDDFTASGLSYFRKKADTSEYSGKIYRVLDSIKNGVLADLVDQTNLRVYVIIYLATRWAVHHIEQVIKSWQTEYGQEFLCKIIPIQLLTDDVCVRRDMDGLFFEILQNYFDATIVDRHWQKGRYQNPYLGFDECALPIVLSHNTPNNSIPILWFGQQHTVQGLFPRVSRHKEER